MTSVLCIGTWRDSTRIRLKDAFDATFVEKPAEALALAAETRGSFRGLAMGNAPADASVIAAFPSVEIIASLGVGYDGVDTAAAASRGTIVTNTPDVLTEEVADTTLGLLLMTVRELSASERYLRAGRWAAEGDFPLTAATMRDRTVGITGYGRIGAAVARRLDAMQVPVRYHARTRRDGVAYPYYDDLTSMARDVDTLISILPGGDATRGLVDANVLAALGPDGVFVNIGRGSAVDQPALIRALADGTIRSAGLDVFDGEPHVPDELIALPNAVLLPHVGSASEHTRDAMGGLVVDNLVSWFGEGRPVTPVAETPWPRQAS